MTEKTKRFSLDARIFTVILTGNAIIGFLLGNSLMIWPDLTASCDPSRFEGQSKHHQCTATASTSSPTGDCEIMHIEMQKPSYQYLSERNDKNDALSEERPNEQPFEENLALEVRKASEDYLRDKTRLVETITSIISDIGLCTLCSSFNCYDDDGKGKGGDGGGSVSCAGLFRDGHTVLHTTPKEGLLTIDIVNVGPVLELYKRIDVVKKHLSIIGGIGTNAPDIKWGHKLRGFFPVEGSFGHLYPGRELVPSTLQPAAFHSKEEVASVTTPFRQIDIWDTLEDAEEPNYFDGLKWGLNMTGDKRWNMTEYASPRKTLFFNGKSRADDSTHTPCNEAIVHPGMFTHPHPRTVAIIGQGDGAVLREVLKHDTVEIVKMIEPDRTLVDVAKKHFPFLSDCSIISGSTECCYDDPRVELIIEDPIQWFSTHDKSSSLLSFDVIIAEASQSLAIDSNYLTSLYSALSKDDGILIIRLGDNPLFHYPWQKYSPNLREYNMISLLEKHPDTAAMIAYEDTACGFEAFESFVLACRNIECRDSWYSESSFIDDAIRRRTRALTKVTEEQPVLLSSYDGNTHESYQHLPKPWETVYCRREPQPYECSFFYGSSDGENRTIHDLGITSDSNASLTLQWWEEEDKKDLSMGVFASEPIKKGDWIMPSDATYSIVVPGRLLHILREQKHDNAKAKDLLEYIEQNGHRSSSAMEEGIDSVIVEVGDSLLIGKVDSRAEANVESLRSSLMKSYDHGRDYKRPVFSPVFDRRRLLLDTILVSNQDIDEGEEILVYDGVSILSRKYLLCHKGLVHELCATCEDKSNC